MNDSMSGASAQTMHSTARKASKRTSRGCDLLYVPTLLRSSEEVLMTFRLSPVGKGPVRAVDVEQADEHLEQLVELGQGGGLVRLGA